MSIHRRLVSTCTIAREYYETDETRQRIRHFQGTEQVKCKLDAKRGSSNDLQYGKVVDDHNYVLFLAPDVEISEQHVVTQGDKEFKVNWVRPYKNGRGALHHYECDVEEIR